MDSTQSFALALTYVAQSLGIDTDRAALSASLQGRSDWDVLTGAVVVEVGQYGTYPGSGPAVMKFDNGNYYYVSDVADRKVTNTDYTNVDMALFGTPTSWARYERYVPKMVYVTSEVDGITYKRLPTAPQRMYVRKPTGTQKTDFSVTVATPREFSGIPDTRKAFSDEVRVMGVASYPINGYPNEEFYVDIDDWGNFTGTGHVAKLQGYSVGDLSETKPVQKSRLVVPRPADPVITPTAPARVVVQSIADVTYRIPLTPSDMHFTYLRDDRQAVRYRVMQRCTIQDYGREGKAQVIIRGRTIKLLGTFYYKGRTFLLPELDNPDIPRFKYWYGVPEVVDGIRIVEELPDYSDVPQTVAEVRAELPPRHYNLSHYVTAGVEHLSLRLERVLLTLKGK